jgi:hypothetical protein
MPLEGRQLGENCFHYDYHTQIAYRHKTPFAKKGGGPIY